VWRGENLTRETLKVLKAAKRQGGSKQMKPSSAELDTKDVNSYATALFCFNAAVDREAQPKPSSHTRHFIRND
jgi:hypothetical protein